jgi:hypothetical protein
MDENRLSPVRCGRTRRSTTVAGPQGVAALAAPAGPDRAEPERAAPEAARAPAVPDFSVADFAVPNCGVPEALAMVGVALALLMSATLPAALQRM